VENALKSACGEQAIWSGGGCTIGSESVILVGGERGNFLVCVKKGIAQRSRWHETPMTDHSIFTVASHESGWRLDIFLVHHCPQYSRTLIRNAIMNGGVRINEEEKHYSNGKPGFRLKPGQVVHFTVPEIPYNAPIPEDIPLDIVYEDDYLAVINKPANMVVHPSRGHWDGTLVSALAFRYGNQLSRLRGPVRPGVVHRLDKDTTGAILVAKDDSVHGKLAMLFERRKIEKEYVAIVLGTPHLDRDMLNFPIGLHPKKKEKMRIVSADALEAKPAQTFYEVINRYGKWSTVRCFPKTGRTHQIRVHLAHIGHPILCDKNYGGGKTITQEELLHKVPFSLSEEQSEGTVLLQRQALHAFRLSFVHPATEELLEVTAPLPADMQSVLDCLELG
jgi:23S rRNA pseudouridine1911/1915/1917 synthase